MEYMINIKKLCEGIATDERYNRIPQWEEWCNIKVKNIDDFINIRKKLLSMKYASFKLAIYKNNEICYYNDKFPLDDESLVDFINNAFKQPKPLEEWNIAPATRLNGYVYYIKRAAEYNGTITNEYYAKSFDNKEDAIAALKDLENYSF